MNTIEVRERLFAGLTFGDVSSVRSALDDGADPNAKDRDGITALMRAARRGGLESAVLLLDRGADVNAAGNGWESALMEAARHGNPKVAALLLDRGAKVDAWNYQGQTPLMAAAASFNNSEAMVALLLERGASADAEDWGNEYEERGPRTVYWYASTNGNKDVLALISAHQKAQELARNLTAALPPAHDDPMDRPARRPVGAREPEPIAPARSSRPRL